MNPQQLTNEQFALWMATQVTHQKLIDTADYLYDWLESKKPKQAEIKYYDSEGNDIFKPKL